MPLSEETEEQMRNKVIDIYQSGKSCKAISKALGLQRTTVRAIIHNGENIEQWWTYPGVAGLPKLLQEHIDNSSRRSQKHPEQPLKNCRPHLPQLRSVFMIQQ